MAPSATAAAVDVRSTVGPSEHRDGTCLDQCPHFGVVESAFRTDHQDHIAGVAQGQFRERGGRRLVENGDHTPASRRCRAPARARPRSGADAATCGT